MANIFHPLLALIASVSCVLLRRTTTLTTNNRQSGITAFDDHAIHYEQYG